MGTWPHAPAAHLPGTRPARVQLTTVRGVLVLVIVSAQLATNAHLLRTPAAFCRSRAALPLLDLVAWLGWNTVLLALVVEAHGTNLARRSSRRGDGVALDLPLTAHWPKLLVWIPFAGALHLPLHTCCVLLHARVVASPQPVPAWWHCDINQTPRAFLVPVGFLCCRHCAVTILVWF